MYIVNHKMNNYNIVTAISLLLVIVFIWWSFFPKVTPYNPSVQKNGTFTSVDLDTNRKLVVDQLTYIKSNAPRMYHVNNDAIDQLIKVVPTSSYDQLVTIMQLTPWYLLSYYPATKLESPRALNYIRYGVGSLGWSWYIGYFPEQQIQIFVSISRASPASPPVVKKAGLEMETATFYSVDFHIGVGKELTHFTNVGKGVYTRSGNSKPRYTLSLENGMVSWVDKDKFMIDVSWDSGKNAINATFDSSTPPSFNTKEGCMCLDGLGTPYYSYPSPKVNASVMFKGTAYNRLAGDGWIDRQMGGSIPSKGLIIGAVQSMFANKLGLGPYLWNNLHLDVGGPNARQYMVYAILSDAPQLNKTLEMKIIKYVNGIPSYDTKGTAVVLTNSKNLPTSYKIKIEGEDDLILKSIGLPIFMDATGNPHGAGAATMTDSKGKSMGWAFMESSNMASPTQILENALIAANIPKNKWYLWKKPSSFNKALFFTAILLGLVSIIALVGSIVGGGVHYFRQRKI